MAMVRTPTIGEASHGVPSTEPVTRPESRAPLEFVAVGCSLSETPLAELERLLTEISDQRIADGWEARTSIRELAVLRTCQRFEFYALVDQGVDLEEALQLPPSTWKMWDGAAAVRHLFLVAGGLESVAVGEPEVRDQLRRASGKVRTRYPRPVVRRLIQHACSAAEAQSPPSTSPSVAALAASKLLEEAAAPFPRVLVLGSGVVGRKVAERLSSFARLTIVYRSHPPSEAFLRETGARAVPWDSLRAELPYTDCIVTAAKGSGRLIGPETLVSRRHPLLIVDLGVPRNIDPRIADTPGVQLFDLSHLRRPFDSPAVYQARSPELVRAAERAWAGTETELWEPALAGWRVAVDRLRRAELDHARPFLRAASAEEWAAIDRLTERLARQLLEPVVRRLRALPPGPTSERTRETVLGFVQPDAAGP